MNVSNILLVVGSCLIGLGIALLVKSKNQMFIGLIIGGGAMIIGSLVYRYFKKSPSLKKSMKQLLEFIPPKSGYVSRYDDYATEIITDGSIPKEDIQIRKIGFKDDTNRYTLWENDVSTPAEIEYSENFKETKGAFYLDIYIKSEHCDKPGIVCDDSKPEYTDGEYIRIKPHSLSPANFVENDDQKTYTGRFNLNYNYEDNETPVYINLVFTVT